MNYCETNLASGCQKNSIGVCRGIAQVASAPGSGPGGPQFKSGCPDHLNIIMKSKAVIDCL